MNIIIAITGASGVIYGIRLMEAVRKAQLPVVMHLVMSDAARDNIRIETDHAVEDVLALADHVYDNRDLAARISSGSFLVDGMVVLPCSMKTLSAVANGYADTLIARACDVSLKENRTLILCPRETPLNAIHLENMLKLSRLGVRIIPPIPAFYNHPRSLEDVIDHHVMKVLDQLKIRHGLGRRWE